MDSSFVDLRERPHRPIAIAEAAVASATTPESVEDALHTAVALVLRHLAAILLADHLSRPEATSARFRRERDSLLSPPAPSLGQLCQFVAWASRSGEGFCPPLHHWGEKERQGRGPALLREFVKLRNRQAHAPNVRRTHVRLEGVTRAQELFEEAMRELAFLREWPLAHVQEARVRGDGGPEYTLCILHGDGPLPPRRPLRSALHLPIAGTVLLRPDFQEALRLDPFLSWETDTREAPRRLLLLHGRDRRKRLELTALYQEHRAHLDAEATAAVMEQSEENRRRHIRLGAPAPSAGDLPHWSVRASVAPRSAASPSLAPDEVARSLSPDEVARSLSPDEVARSLSPDEVAPPSAAAAPTAAPDAPAQSSDPLPSRPLRSLPRLLVPLALLAFAAVVGALLAWSAGKLTGDSTTTESGANASGSPEDQGDLAPFAPILIESLHPEARVQAERAIDVAHQERRLRAAGSREAYGELFRAPADFVCWYGRSQPTTAQAFLGRIDSSGDLGEDRGWAPVWIGAQGVVLVSTLADRPPWVLFVERDPSAGGRIAGEAGVDPEGNPLIHRSCAADWHPQLAYRVRELLADPGRRLR